MVKKYGVIAWQIELYKHLLLLKASFTMKKKKQSECGPKQTAWLRLTSDGE